VFDRAGLVGTTLPTGLTVVAKPDRSLPLVSVCVVVGVGSGNETADSNGITHFLEHMMFKGSRDYPPGALQRAIEGMGGVLNGATGRDNTYLYATVPADQFASALAGLADTVTAPTFPEDQIDRERVVVATEIGSARERMGDVARDLLFHLAYQEHPYRMPVAGTVQSLIRVKREDLVAWHRTWYTADNMAVAVVGDIDPAEAIARVAESLSGLAKSERARPPAVPEPAPVDRREARETLNITRGHVRIGFLTPGFDDLKANCALDVILFMLGRGYSSRLGVTIRDREKLAEAVGATYVSQHDPSLFEVWAICEPQRVGPVRAALMRQLAELSRHAPPETELRRARRLLEGQFLIDNESFSQQARSLATFAINGDAMRIADYLAVVRGLTADDIVAVARQYLDVGRCTILILEPPPPAPGGGDAHGAPA
jgi:zinc protease